MLNLIYGRAKSGKTAYINGLIEKLSENGTENILYIVPEQNSFKTECDMLNLFGDDSSGIVERVIHFKRLAKKIINESGYFSKPLIDENCRRVYMSMAVEALKESLDIFKKCSKSNAVGCLIGIANEFGQCGVTSEALISSADLSGNEILKKKARELSLILEAYKALVEKSFSDGLDEMTFASKLANETDFFKGKTVFIDEFSGFTNQEYELICRMCEKCENVYISLCLDSVTDVKYSTDVFYYTQQTAKRLFSISKKANVKFGTYECKCNCFEENSPLWVIEKNLFRSVKSPYGENTDKVNIVLCENARKEAGYIALTIKRLVREKGYRYRDFAVIERGNRFDSHLRSGFKKYGIPVFEDSRHLMKNENIVRLVSDSLSAVNNNFDSEFILRSVKTGLYSIEKKDIENIENYILVWQIDRSKWLSEWTGHPDGYGNDMDEKAKERLDKINDVRKKIIAPLVKLKNNLENADGFEGVRAIYDFLIETEADKNLLKTATVLNDTGRSDLAGECERVWDEFMVILDRFANTLGKEKYPLSRFCELFSVMIEEADTGEIPRGIDEITVGDALRIRLENKKIVFVAGANEGIFPQNNEASFVLMKRERKLLKNGDTELYEDGEIFASKERFLVYYACTRPSEKLYVTYSASDAGGATMTKSEAVTEIKSCVPGCAYIENAFIPMLDKIESDESAFENAAEHFNENNVNVASLKAYLSSKDEYRGKINALERASKKKKAQICSKATATELFGKNMHLSPSAVEKYHKCPFMYFCLYGIRAKKLKKAELAPNIRGLVIHEVLEKLFKKYSAKELCGLEDDILKKDISSFVEDYISEKMGGREEIDRRTLYSLGRIEKSIFDIGKRLIFEFSHCEFVTDAMELEIKNGAEIEEYTLELCDGGSVSLHGVVDRVDKYETENGTYIRVVDYKTGGKEFNLDDTVSGLNLQMLIYLMCLWSNGHKRYGDRIIPAGVLYLPAKSGIPTLERNESDERVNAEKTAQGQMNGIVLSTPEVLNAMDTTGEGILLSNKIIKDGKPGKYALTMKQMNKLFGEMNRVIIETGEALQNGDIAVFPMLSGDYKYTCDYCDYKSVCCYEENDEHNEIVSREKELLTVNEEDEE